MVVNKEWNKGWGIIVVIEIFKWIVRVKCSLFIGEGLLIFVEFILRIC